jgi:hypothetical protein
MGCQRPEITDVANEDRSAELGHGDDQGVNGRSALPRGAQHACSASEARQEFRNWYELPTLWARLTDLTIGSTWSWRARCPKWPPDRKSKVHCVGGSDLEHTGSNAKSLVSELTPRRSIGKRDEPPRDFMGPDLHLSACVGVQVGVEGGTRNKTPRVLAQRSLLGPRHPTAVIVKRLR